MSHCAAAADVNLKIKQLGPNLVTALVTLVSTTSLFAFKIGVFLQVILKCAILWQANHVSSISFFILFGCFFALNMV